jgi:hypothetical protein
VSRQAFIGVLACARAADGEFPDSERQLLDLICRSHQFTRAMPQAEYAEAATEAKRRISELGWERAIAGFLAMLPPQWAYSTLLSTIDICLIDADQHKAETACIETVARYFEIPKSSADNFVMWFRIKNGLLADADAAQ